jgi:hypothetical protein
LVVAEGSAGTGRASAPRTARSHLRPPAWVSPSPSRQADDPSAPVVRGLLAAVEAAPSFMKGNPEGTAVDLGEYLRGWADAISRSNPETLREAARELEDRLCGVGLTPDHTMIIGRIGSFLPALMTERGLECAFKQTDKEDVVLWALMDAWRNSGLPRPTALDRIEQTAKDERTRRRMISPQKEMIERTAEATKPATAGQPAALSEPVLAR